MFLKTKNTNTITNANTNTVQEKNAEYTFRRLFWVI